MEKAALCCVLLLLAACSAQGTDQRDAGSADAAPVDAKIEDANIEDANMTDRFFSDFRPKPDRGPGCDSAHYMSQDDPRCAQLPGCAPLPLVRCDCACVLCEWGKCIAVYCDDSCMVDMAPQPKDMAASLEAGPTDAGADSAH